MWWPWWAARRTPTPTLLSTASAERAGTSGMTCSPVSTATGSSRFSAGDAAPLAPAKSLLPQFGPGPVVVGPVVPDLQSGTKSAEEAIFGLRAAPAWPDAPRPVLADDLLPERALLGDQGARQRLVEDIYSPLRESGSALLETLSTYLQQAASLEAAARMLFVHPNT